MEENQQVPMNVPENIVPQQPKTTSKKPFFALGAVVVIAVAAWFAYSAYASPAKVWEKFIADSANMPSMGQTSVSEAVSMSYVDNGKVPDSMENNPGVAFFSGVKVSVNGSAYTDSSDIAHPQMSADLSYSLGSGNTSFSSSAKLVLKDKDIYLNLGDNPFVNSIWAFVAPGEKVEWIKVNADEIQKASGATTTVSTDYAKQVKIYQDILKNHLPKAMVLDKYIDRQTLRGVRTLHYANKVDKTELKAMMNEFVEAVLKQAAEMDSTTPEQMAEARDLVTKVFENFVDRFEVSTFETWIGVTDHKLHKLKIVSNAPSLVSLVAGASDPAVTSIEDPKQGVEAMLKAITFDGQFTLEEEYYDFGKKQDLKVPDNALDIAEKIREQSAKKPIIIDDSGLEFQGMP